jgi:fibronectin type 3 domain-containing protein/methionine-rich copper-binding protein CopC
MNQDGDAINGEVPDDQFSTSVTLTPIPAFERQFDFGITSSPVAAGYTQVLHGTNYTSTLGFGWLSGTVNSRDSGATYGNELERDFNLTELATFVIDVPESTVYEVTMTMGDGLSLRDEMGVFLEGILVDSVTSPSGAYVTNTYKVTVTDGQLTLLLDHLGGSNTLVMINALDVLALNPDTAGPQVVDTNPSGEVIESMGRIEVSFNEGMDGSTFTLADVVSLTGPSVAISPTAVNQLSPATFEVLFPSQIELGAYTLTIGPDITDVTGNPMNQDGDGINGETFEDRFSTTVNIVPIPPFEQHFDFGTTSSPVAGGYTRVAETTGYSSAQGFGWLSGVVNSRDHGSLTGTDLERDFNMSEFATFVMDVLPEPTLYDVTLTMGDALSERDLMGVIIEGSLVDTVTSPSGQYVTNTYRVSVADGQLTLLLDDLGGNNTLVMINGLDIVEVGPDNSGPQVFNSDPVSEISGSLDRFTVTFDETIDAQTFTTADIVNLSGPSGAIPPLAVNQLAANTFEITFNSQTELEIYSLTLGPDIVDVASNLMNQDGDAINGEASDDQFTSSVTIVPIPPFELHFDFGTASSPVADGYTRVASNTVYSSSTGFGWVSDVINSRDSGNKKGNDFERDFNLTELGTFAADVPSGAAQYDVTVTMGDALALRDEMGVFLEGNLVSFVTAPRGTYAIETYRVTVSDGQLTLLLDDLGGKNSLVMLNGLDIVEAPVETVAVAIAQSNEENSPAANLSASARIFQSPFTAFSIDTEDAKSLEQQVDESQDDVVAAVYAPADFGANLSAGYEIRKDDLNPEESEKSLSYPETQLDLLDLLYADPDNGPGNSLIGALLFLGV